MAKIYGALEVAQVEWFTQSPDTRPSASANIYRVIYASDVKQIQVSDGTTWRPANISIYTVATLPAAGATNQYQIAFITDTLQVKVSNGTVWTTIGARLDTYTTGTVPSASSYANQMIWVSDIQQIQVSNGTSWVSVGSKSGSKNYFSTSNANPDFATNTVSPWSACTLTLSSGVPSGAPTLTATQMAIATTGTNPLIASSSAYNLQLTKSAANAQGQGFISSALTIDREDLAKVLTGSFSYEVISGTIDLSGASTQSLEIWVYNTVSGVWTQPAGYRGMNTGSGTGKVSFTFQTDSTAANNSYKIAVITAQTSTSAYVVNFNDFVIGPTVVVNGTPVTDWQSYTPAFTGFGTATSVQFQWRRVGSDVEIRGKFTSGTSTAVEARIGLPSVTSADTSRIPSIQLCGQWQASSTGTNSIFNVLIEPSVTYMTFSFRDGGAGAFTKQNGSAMASSGNSYGLYARLPVQGWSSNVQISSDTDTRVVAASVNTLSSTSITANTALQFTTTVVDTHGAITTGAGYKFTAPVSGNYRISASMPGLTAGAGSLYAAKNGVFTFSQQNFITSSTSTQGGGGSIILPLNAGDTVQLAFNGTVTAASNNFNFNIDRISGPSVVAASETVAALVQSSTSNIATTDSLVTFSSVVGDTHAAYNTTTGLYTIPVSGWYEVKAHLTISSLALTTGQGFGVSLYRNGSLSRPMGNIFGNGASNAYRVFGSGFVYCNAGDTIGIYAFNGNTTTALTSVAVTNNWASFSKV